MTCCVACVGGSQTIQSTRLCSYSSSADQEESSHVQSRDLATPIQHPNKNEPVTVHWRSPQVSIASKSLVEEAVQDPTEGSVSNQEREIQLRQWNLPELEGIEWREVLICVHHLVGYK